MENQPTVITDCAKHALERVCSGAGLDPVAHYYSPTFVDHVNDLEFRGLEGVRTSIALYRKILTEITISVEDQLAAGDRVTSRFVVSGLRDIEELSAPEAAAQLGITVSALKSRLHRARVSLRDLLTDR